VLVILIIITPSDGDIVTLYDTGPHTVSLVTGSHDTIVLKQPLAVVKMLVIGDGGPKIRTYDKNHTGEY